MPFSSKNSLKYGERTVKRLELGYRGDWFGESVGFDDCIAEHKAFSEML